MCLDAMTLKTRAILGGFLILVKSLFAFGLGVYLLLHDQSNSNSAQWWQFVVEGAFTCFILTPVLVYGVWKEHRVCVCVWLGFNVASMVTVTCLMIALAQLTVYLSIKLIIAYYCSLTWTFLALFLVWPLQHALKPPPDMLLDSEFM